MCVCDLCIYTGIRMKLVLTAPSSTTRSLAPYPYYITIPTRCLPRIVDLFIQKSMLSASVEHHELKPGYQPITK